MEPRHEGDVVGITALQGHGGVAMGVDEPGHEEPAAAIEDPGVGMREPESGFGRGVGGDQRDAVADDADGTAKSVRLTACHRQDGGIGEEKY